MKRKSLFGALLLLVCVFAYFSANAMSTADFDKGMAQGISYAESGLYYEAKDEFQWFADANWGALNSGQQQYLLDYLDAAKAQISALEANAKKVTTEQFNNGTAAGIAYFNRGMYYEARDEFQWFADANWGALNSGQQQYLLDYLDAAKAQISALEANAKKVTTEQFNNGTAAGIAYFNRGMYYEARDEFQWFADANWGALNSGQQQYLLDYLGGSKAKIQQIESQKSASSASYGGGSYSGTSVTQGYIGNKNTKKFHRSSCRTLPSAKNRVSFSSRDEAISQNYSPCKNCKP